jgi:transcriptional regulator
MYEVAAFRETRVEVMQALIRAHPLATLVSVSGGVAEANHLPLLVAPDPAPKGSLRGHVARANPLWRQLPEGEVLAVCHAVLVPVQTRTRQGRADLELCRGPCPRPAGGS